MLWPDVVDPHRHADVVRWRKAERERLINDRLAISRGVWNISVPAKEAEVVVPDVVTAPVVGFDQSCYRLGYGGGFFDRTLATMRPKPRVFGVGYQQAAVATIYPQPHDVPVDLMVTELGLVAAEARANLETSQREHKS